MLPDWPEAENCLQQCYDETLKRFCSSFGAVHNNRENFINRLKRLIEDARPGELRPMTTCEMLMISLLTMENKAAQSYLHNLQPNPRMTGGLAQKKYCGLTPIHVSAFDGQLEMLSMLIERWNCHTPAGKKCSKERLCVHVQDQNGLTALHMAARRDCVNTVAFLLSIDLGLSTVQSDEGRAALHEAARYGGFSCFKVIAKANLTILSMEDKKGRTPVQEARIRFDPDDVEALLHESQNEDKL